MNNDITNYNLSIPASVPVSVSWKNKLTQWIGRIWGKFVYFSSELRHLIDRIKGIDPIAQATIPVPNPPVRSLSQLPRAPSVRATPANETALAPRVTQPPRAQARPKRTVIPTKPKRVYTPPPPPPVGFEFREEGGAGNCLLYSFLAGLKVQYPDQAARYTIDNLRSLGVEFIKKQLANGSDPDEVELVRGYLDVDRGDYNEFRPLQNKVATNEAYLKILSRNGTFCSTSCLYALNSLFHIPVWVYEQHYTSREHQIQKFNVTESTHPPICLYRVANSHYQLMVPKKTDPKIEEKN